MLKRLKTFERNFERKNPNGPLQHRNCFLNHFQAQKDCHFVPAIGFFSIGYQKIENMLYKHALIPCPINQNYTSKICTYAIMHLCGFPSNINQRFIPHFGTAYRFATERRVPPPKARLLAVSLFKAIKIRSCVFKLLAPGNDMLCVLLTRMP